MFSNGVLLRVELNTGHVAARLEQVPTEHEASALPARQLPEFTGKIAPREARRNDLSVRCQQTDTGAFIARNKPTAS